MKLSKLFPGYFPARSSFDSFFSGFCSSALL